MSVPVFLIEDLAAHIAEFRPEASPGDLIFIGPKGGIMRRSFQARLGHADPALSMGLYAHVPDELDRRAAQHLDEMFTADERRRADDA